MPFSPWQRVTAENDQAIDTVARHDARFHYGEAYGHLMLRTLFNVRLLLKRAYRGLVTSYEVGVAPGAPCRLPYRKPYTERIGLGASRVAG